MIDDLRKTSLISGCGRFVLEDLSFFFIEGASGILRISLLKRYHPAALSSVLHSAKENSNRNGNVNIQLNLNKIMKSEIVGETRTAYTCAHIWGKCANMMQILFQSINKEPSFLLVKSCSLHWLKLLNHVI